MSLPYYRKHVERWRSSPTVRMMNLLERGAFSELMDLSWQMGPIPDDPSELARLIGTDPQEFEKAWTERLKNCWKKTKKGLINPQLEIERKWAESKTYKSTKAATARWQGGNGHANAMRMHSKRNADAYADASPKHMHIDKEEDKDKEEEKRRGEKSAARLRFDPKAENGEGDFVGTDRQKLRELVRSRYLEDLGEKWLEATFVSMVEWCMDNPRKISAKKDHWAFAIGWFRREASKKREW